MDMRRARVAVLPLLLVACRGAPARDAAPRPAVPGPGDAAHVAAGTSPSATRLPAPAGTGTPAAPVVPSRTSPGVPPSPRASAGGKPPMCPAQGRATCAAYDAAHAWWGPALLSPREGTATFVLFARDGRFGPGDGRRELPREVWVVLPGRVGPYDGGLGEVLGSGGIVLVGTRTKSPYANDPSAPTVRVRGHDAAVAMARSDVPGQTYRVVEWTRRDGAAFVSWRVMDDGETRSLEDLIRRVDALAES